MVGILICETVFTIEQIIWAVKILKDVGSQLEFNTVFNTLLTHQIFKKTH